jgi:hypothetical protein
MHRIINYNLILKLKKEKSIAHALQKAWHLVTHKFLCVTNISDVLKI